MAPATSMEGGIGNGCAWGQLDAVAIIREVVGTARLPGGAARACQPGAEPQLRLVSVSAREPPGPVLIRKSFSAARTDEPGIVGRDSGTRILRDGEPTASRARSSRGRRNDESPTPVLHSASSEPGLVEQRQRVSGSERPRGLWSVANSAGSWRMALFPSDLSLFERSCSAAPKSVESVNDVKRDAAGKDRSPAGPSWRSSPGD